MPCVEPGPTPESEALIEARSSLVIVALNVAATHIDGRPPWIERMQEHVEAVQLLDEAVDIYVAKRHAATTRAMR